MMVVQIELQAREKEMMGIIYDCEVCQLGAKLLCCDCCPRTYHLECLDPALQDIPKEKWECPICCQKSFDAERGNHVDSKSKRAQTKIIICRSRNENKSSTTGMTNQTLESSTVGRKKASGKDKFSSSQCGKRGWELDCSPSDKSNNERCHPLQDGSMGGSSLHVSVNRKLAVSLPHRRVDKSVIPAKGVVSLSEKINSNMNENSSEKIPKASPEEISPGKKNVPALEPGTGAARKRNHKIHPHDTTKTRKTEKGKLGPDTSRKSMSKENDSHPGPSKSHGKSKIIGHKARSTPSKQDVKADRVEIQPNDEVDRVVGCRVHSNETVSGCNDIETNASDPPVLDSFVKNDLSKLSGENPICEMPLDRIGGRNSTKDNQDVASCADGGSNINNRFNTDKLQVYRRSVAKYCKERNFMDCLRREIGDCDSIILNNRNQDDNIASEACVDNDGSKDCQTHTSDEHTSTKEGKRDRRMNIACQKNVTKSYLVEYKSSTISYEFLVKWVGKSHLHDNWIPESELKVLAKCKLENYKAKYGTATMNLCQDEWKTPQRVIATRSCSDGSTEAYVKWTGLAYDECTWERMDGPAFANSSCVVDLFFRFEHKTSEDDTAKLASVRRNDIQQSDVITLVEQPKELVGGSLFPHQLEALNWLCKSWHKSRNVILADEMGLGKTVSACAFISSLYFEFKAKLPCLVLVPLSTMPNWMSEFALWAPDLNVVEYHGNLKARGIIREYEWHVHDPHGLNKKISAYKFNVLLTTYEMVLCDPSHLRGIPWEVLVVDEGHRLKNSESKLFGLLNAFSFQHRVLLTGTPLQNNIGEMYNLLRFLQPDSFPSISSFKEFNDLTTAEKVGELKKLVAPHMLRRLKKDAMKNIPPKSERVVPVELSSIQAEYYRAMLTKNYQILRNTGKGAPQQSMLNIVMQLRKVCNHPYLIPGTEPESGSVKFLHEMSIKASAKLTLLHSMLKALHREGHKVLIFSQMTKLLDILEDYLTIEFGSNTYERVDGSVSVAERQAAIERFNTNKNRFIFLL